MGNSSVDFSTTANFTYSSGSGPVASGDALIFNAAGSAGTSLTDDLAAGDIFTSITFGTSASAYTITGNSFDLGTGTPSTSFTNSSTTALETINDNIALGNAVQTFSIATGGTTLGGNISGLGSSSGITLTGGGTLTLSGTNSYSGTTTVGAGTLIASGTNTSAGNTTVNSGSGVLEFDNATNGGLASGTLTLSGSGATLNVAVPTSLSNAVTMSANFSVTGGNSLTFGGAFTNNGSVILTNSGSGTVSLSGGVTVANLEFHSGTFIINSVISDASGTGKITSQGGAPTITLSGNNTFGGGVVLSSGGVVNVNAAGTSSSNSALGTGPISITSTSNPTLNNTSGSAITLLTNNALSFSAASQNLSLGSATATLGNNNINFGTGAVTLPGSETIAFVSGGTGETYTFGGTATNTLAGTTGISLTVNSSSTTNLFSLGSLVLSSASTAAITDTIQGSGNVTITGAVTNGTAFNNGLTKAGTGTLVLSGASTYTGATTVNASGGTLQVGAVGGSTGSLATSGVTVNTGGTFLFANSNAALTTSGATVSLTGGTLSTARVTGTNTTVGIAQTMGLLTLTTSTTTPTINFGSGTGAQNALTFSSLSSTNALNVYNWEGTVYAASATSDAGKNDQLDFVSNSNLSTEAAEVNFYSGNGTGFLGTGEVIMSGSDYEIVPTAVPEPSTIYGAILLLGATGWHSRRRLQGLWQVR